MDAEEHGYYEEYARRFRGTARQVVWGSDASQRLRFDVLLSVTEQLLGEAWKGLFLLDFGCGRGDLLPVLEAGGFHGRYLGMDAISINIEDARARVARAPLPFPTELVCQDWNAEEPLGFGQPDLVLVSGSFNATPAAHRDATFRRLLCDRARLGVVANFWRRDARLPPEAAGTVVTDSSPEEMLKLVDPAVFKRILRADYLWHDYTVGAVRWP